MAARDLRYKYFFQLKDDLQAAAICVGHHKEDSVETILINSSAGYRTVWDDGHQS